MSTIQVVLDEELLVAADNAARSHRVNRSALIRAALRTYLNRLELRALEERDRIGYEAQPDDEFDGWENLAAWPED